MPICMICNFESKDISRHLKFEHKISTKEYKDKYQVEVIDSSVEEKRKKTCFELYGDPNYRNEEAKKLSNEIFEGGHSLRDPLIREKARKTKRELYGDPDFTNREKASQTCLKKYGVKNPSQIKEVKQKAVDTLMEKYGKIFNWEREPVFSKEELIDMHVNKKMTLAEIGATKDMDAPAVGYWMKKYNIPVTKRIVSPKTKEYCPADVVVKDYLSSCVENNKVLSFHEYGKIREQKNMLRLKRLFNSGRPYNNLKERLFEVALHPDSWPGFLKNIK